MISQKYTRVFMNEHRPVEPGVVIAEEGMALVYVRTAGETCVRPSTGAAGEVFAGFSWTRNSVPATLPMVIETKVPASLTVHLDRLPIAGQLLVRVGGDALDLVGSAPADATEVRLVGQDLTFHADHVGQNLMIQLQYEPTLQEARQILGDNLIGGLASSAEQMIGLLTRADICTSFYDASADFTSAMHPSLGADGRLTVGGNGTVLTNVTIVEAPSAANPFIVVRANV